MIKSVKQTYGGMVKDISKSQMPGVNYFDATYGRITATDNSSEYSFTNEKGSVELFDFPNVVIQSSQIKYKNTVLPLGMNNTIKPGTYSNHRLNGHTETSEGLVLFTIAKSNNSDLDCIWIYKNNSLKLLYCNHLGFKLSNPITAISNYENNKVEKIYWVDGIHQVRSLNIHHSITNGDNEEIWNIDLEVLNMVAPFNMRQPKIVGVSTGGNHTAGMIQYAYNLYNVNSSQTNPSPLSELVPLNKSGLGGGDVNELVNTTPIVEISDIDRLYNNIRVYSLKYTSQNQMPTVSLIKDIKVPKSREIKIYDDSTIIRNITIEEFLFLGSDVYIPSDIESKDNRLFMGNYSEKNYDLDLDMRAYAFSSEGRSLTFHNVKSMSNWDDSRLIQSMDIPNSPGDKFDAVSLNYDIFNLKYPFQSSTSVRGGTGYFCEYSITPPSEHKTSNKYFKDNEIYRLAIVFYNKFGKPSNPLWIADFKAPEGNLTGVYNALGFKFRPSFYSWLESQTDIYTKPVGYKLLIAERNAEDRTIVAGGIVSPMMVNFKNSKNTKYETFQQRKEISENEPKLPNILVRNIGNSEYGVTKPLANADHLSMMSRGSGSDTEVFFNNRYFGGRTWQYDHMLQMYSPEILFNKGVSIPSTLRVKVKGAMANTFNAVWGKEYWFRDGVGYADISSKGIQGVSTHYAAYSETTEGSESYVFDNGLISDALGGNENRYNRSLWYRRYGLPPLQTKIDNDNPDGYFKIRIPENALSVSNNPISVGTTDYTYIASTSARSINGSASITTSPSLNIGKTRLYGEYHITPANSETVYDLKLEFSYFNGDKITIDETGLSGDKVISLGQSESLGASSSISTFSAFIKPQMLNVTISGEARLEMTADYYAAQFTDKAGQLVYRSKITQINNGFVATSNTNPDNNFEEYYEPADGNTYYNVLGSAEYTQKGQNYKSYNKDSKLRYTNTLQSFKTDGYKLKETGKYGRRIVSINSDNNNCITFVAKGNNNITPSQKEMANDYNISMENASLYCELIKTREDIYLGGIYGGNRYEDKLRTKYNEIGEYQTLGSTAPILIDSPGDTFVQPFKFLRIVAKDQDIVDQGIYHMEEIVEYLTETTIDLSNRNDESLVDWDDKIQYSDSAFHKYNTVYSQKNNLKVHQDSEYYVKKNSTFGTAILPSKMKTSGEVIDTWLEMLPNDGISLDGKYGSLTKMVNFQDQIYAFQNSGLSLLSINPRVQISTEDGIGLQLGTGQVLQEYKYIATTSGSKNKYSIKKSPFGIYYFDDLNRSINVFNGSVAPISETGGLHSYINKYPLRDLKNSLPQISGGVTTGYDPLNNDVLFTFNFLNGKSDTLIFNEKRNLFVSRRDDSISWYLNDQGRLYTNTKDSKIHELNVGDYNKYYGVNKDTTVTFLVNPHVDLDTIIQNIEYKSEVYNNGVDVDNQTLTHIRVFNEYQDSGVIPLINNRRGNLQRRFRSWNAVAPRNNNTRQRVRNPWNYLELTFKNTDNLELILHDILVSYSI